MRYQGSEAYNYDFAERQRALEGREPSFEVLPGGGLDARARRGVSPEFLARAKMALLAAAVFFCVGAARVGISSATVSMLAANSTLRSQVTDAQNLNDELKIERAVLSSNSRIARIATQNYGMSLSSDAVSVKVGEAAAAEQAELAAEAAEVAAAEAAAQAEADAAARIAATAAEVAQLTAADATVAGMDAEATVATAPAAEEPVDAAEEPAVDEAADEAADAASDGEAAQLADESGEAADVA